MRQIIYMGKNSTVFGIDWIWIHKVHSLSIFTQEKNKTLINLLNKIQYGHIN